MEIVILKKEKNINIILGGILDFKGAVEFEQAVNEGVADKDITDDVILDCDKLEYISSAGISALLGLYKNLTQKVIR